jgi:ABC-type sugar transport system ATPase subunit
VRRKFGVLFQDDALSASMNVYDNVAFPLREHNRFLIAFTNFKGETIDADVQDIRSFAVGDFADQVRTFFAPDAVKAIREAKATSVGRVQNLFVESLSGGSATVFGVVSEAVTNAANPTPRTEVLRVEVELIDTTAGWKVNRVNILQSPAATSGPLGGTGP